MGHEARQLLIDNPPPKSPYFTLPDVRHFVKETRASRKRKRNGYVSIVSLWGPANKMTEESTTDFLLALLKHSKWEPDYDAVAAEWQLSGTSYMWVSLRLHNRYIMLMICRKSRLKPIVETHDYRIEGDAKITGGDGPPKKREPPPKNTRVRKSKTDTGEGKGNQDGDNSGTPKLPKPKKRKTGKTAEDSRVSEKAKKTKKQKLPVPGEVAVLDNASTPASVTATNTDAQEIHDGEHDNGAVLGLHIGEDARSDK